VTFRRVLAAALTVVLLALATPAVANAQAQPKGTDVLGQLFGRDKYGGHLGDYSLSSYQLDWDVDTDNDIGLPGGIGPQIPVAPKPKGAIADVAEGLANFLWSISLIVVKLIGGLFAWAFSIDFLTGPHGILQPIGNATRVMYRDLFGREVLWIAILISAGYAITHMRRGHRGGAGRTLVAAVVYAIVAIGVLQQHGCCRPPRLPGDAGHGVLRARHEGRGACHAHGRRNAKPTSTSATRSSTRRSSYWSSVASRTA
jgi:hypothetical protein